MLRGLAALPAKASSHGDHGPGSQKNWIPCLVFGQLSSVVVSETFDSGVVSVYGGGLMLSLGWTG